MAVVVAEPPGPDCLAGLAPLLGPEARRGLQAVLVERAARWAAAATPGRAVVLVDADVDLPAGVARVADLAAVAPGGPLLLARAACPRLGPEHAAGAREDLAAGSGTVLGPALDGGAYLAAFARPGPAPALPAGPDGLARALDAARARAEEVGLLRHERGLATPEDAAAFLADPRLPADVRAALERR
jgi:glycosyltransferase A (GT-A) superfamily protein (DUF2064 family)